MAKTAFKAMRIFGEHQIERNALLVVEEDRFLGFFHKQDVERMNIPIRSYPDCLILPGLLDSHIHGAMGCDTMDATPEAMRRIGKFLIEEGTTAWVPTTVTADIPSVLRAVRNVRECQAMDGTARIVGCFVEGPYIAKEYRGAHSENLIRPFSKDEVSQLLEAGFVTVLAVAPEQEDVAECIAWAVRRGVKISLAHSGATYEEAGAGIEAGADAVVHTFCGMRSLHHRDPSLIGAALVRDEVYAELIADGIHVQAPAMEILLRCKPREKVILVSDAIRATGLADGEYTLGALPITVRDGVSRIADGSLAGSTATLLSEVRRLILELGVEPLSAVHMASLNPSRRLGLASELGSIANGKKADFIIVDKQYQLQETWMDGKMVVKK